MTTAPQRSEFTVRTYRTRAHLDHDADALAAFGWEVVSVEEEQFVFDYRPAHSLPERVRRWFRGPGPGLIVRYRRVLPH